MRSHHIYHICIKNIIFNKFLSKTQTPIYVYLANVIINRPEIIISR